jgi:hypothetical protein
MRWKKWPYRTTDFGELALLADAGDSKLHDCLQPDCRFKINARARH